MDTFHTFLAILAFVAWIKLLVISALPITRPHRSLFELNRLKDAGDVSASDDSDRLAAFGRLMAVKTILSGLVVAIISVLCVYGFGWFLGAMVIVGVILTKDHIVHISYVQRIVRKWYMPYEQRVVQWALRTSWLDWFISPASGADAAPISSKEELLDLLAHHHSYMQRDEYDRLVAGMSFDEKQIKDVMTPASMIDTARSDDVLGPLVLDEFHKTGHSRFPVIDGDIHHIVGILYVHALLNTSHQKQTVKEAMETDVHYIHESQTLSRALHGFLRTHRHLFIVVNDYRETVGVVSLEDVLEALIGKKIVDEFDRFDDLRLVAESNPHKNNMPRGKKDI